MRGGRGLPVLSLDRKPVGVAIDHFALLAVNRKGVEEGEWRRHRIGERHHRYRSVPVDYRVVVPQVSFDSQSSLKAVVPRVTQIGGSYKKRRRTWFITRDRMPPNAAKSESNLRSFT